MDIFACIFSQTRLSSMTDLGFGVLDTAMVETACLCWRKAHPTFDICTN